jgi:RNA polymerase sporulation-specific sigma factor
MERCLTETERNVIGCYMTGRSYGEIAQTLGISVKSVDNAMQRSRKKLRREFDSKGIG